MIDCEFDDKMADRELKSLGQQLAYCHSINKKLKQPLNIYLTGIGPKLRAIVETQNCKQWAVETRFAEEGAEIS